MSSNELKKATLEIKPYYMTARAADGVTQLAGFRAFKQLVKLGIEPPPKKTETLNFKLKEVDPVELEKEKSPDSKKKDEALIQ